MDEVADEDGVGVVEAEDGEKERSGYEWWMLW